MQLDHRVRDAIAWTIARHLYWFEWADRHPGEIASPAQALQDLDITERLMNDARFVAKVKSLSVAVELAIDGDKMEDFDANQQRIANELRNGARFIGMRLD